MPAELRTPVIDFHSHMLERTAADAGRLHSPSTGFGARVPELIPGTAYANAENASYEPESHIQALDSRGIDAEILSSTAMIQGTSWTDPDHEYELVRGINDEIAKWVSEYPTRFVGSFVLPLLDRAYSIAELNRCVDELGMRVLEMPAAVRGVYLGHPTFHYLWELIEERDVVTFIHPDGTRDLWFQEYAMWNSIGQSIEEAKLLTSLIYEGVLERHSALSIVVAHGGGFLPHNAGRLDRNVKAWPDSVRNLSRKPSEYLNDLYYDTCLYDQRILEALVRRVGPDRIVMGSDFPVGEARPIDFVRDSATFSEQEAEMVLGGTAATILGLRTADNAKLGVVAKG